MTGYTKFTISTWIYSNDPTPVGTREIFLRTGTNGSDQFYVGTTTGLVTMDIGTPEGRWYATTDSALATGGWHLLTFVYDSTLTLANGKLKIYFDAVLQTCTDTAEVTSGAGTLMDATTSTSIGYPTGTYSISAYFDDFAIFNRALTATDISNLYNGTWSSISTINGLAKASVGTFNGLAIASLKTINGLE